MPLICVDGRDHPFPCGWPARAEGCENCRRYCDPQQTREFPTLDEAREVMALTAPYGYDWPVQ